MVLIRPHGLAARPARSLSEDPYVRAVVQDTIPSRRHQRFRVVGLQGIALALLALHFYVRTLPATATPIPLPQSAEAAWWGFWPVTYLPAWAMLTGAIATCAPIFLYWVQVFRLARGRSPHRQPTSCATHTLWLQLTAVLLVVAFYLFPIVHTRWGDAFMLAKGIAFPDAALRLTRSWQAPLDVALHSQIWLWFHESMAWQDAMPVYRLLSPIAGALYLLVALALSRHPLLAPGWVGYGLLITLGVLQLFFGYVENYSFVAAILLAYLWVGLAIIEGRRPLWLAAAVLALANATHPSTIILVPSLLLLGAIRWKWRTPSGNQTIGAVVLQVMLPMLLIGGSTFWFMESSGHGIVTLLTTDRPGGGDARWFVPFTETTTRWEHYTLFSWLHLRDWLNGQMLVAPAVLPTLVVLMLSWWRERRTWIDGTETPAEMRATFAATASFLAVASGFYLLFTLVWNPDYGGQRDWDLFSLAAIPTTLLLAVLLPRLLRGQALWGAVLPLILLQGWHTLAWIYQNTLPWQWPN